MKWTIELSEYDCGLVFFTCVSTQSTRLIFIGEKLVLKKLESPLILFYFKKENKIRKKTLKKWLHSFTKSMYLKNPILGLEIRLPIGKVPLRDNTPLKLKEVSND